jgi:hypothetical protein
MYALPNVYSTVDYGCVVDEDDISLCVEALEEVVNMDDLDLPCDEEFFELLLLYMQENGWAEPANAYDGANLYLNLRTCVLNDLWFQ